MGFITGLELRASNFLGTPLFKHCLQSDTKYFLLQFIMNSTYENRSKTFVGLCKVAYLPPGIVGYSVIKKRGLKS
jgi:hypothetical protein